MTENRAPAQHCPYCGETDLWPHEASHGAWSCRECRRVFAVKFLGIAGGDPARCEPVGSFPIGHEVATIMSFSDAPAPRVAP